MRKLRADDVRRLGAEGMSAIGKLLRAAAVAADDYRARLQPPPTDEELDSYFGQRETKN